MLKQVSHRKIKRNVKERFRVMENRMENSNKQTNKKLEYSFQKERLEEIEKIFKLKIADNFFQDRNSKFSSNLSLQSVK